MKDHAHDDQILRYGLCLTCAEAGDDDMAPEPARQLSLSEAQPDGDTYTPALDRARLGAQAQRVLDLMADGRWRTLAEISDQTRDPEPSISARLRDLRKPAFGGHIIDRRHRGPAEHGLYEYRLVPAQPTQDPTQDKDTTMDTDLAAIDKRKDDAMASVRMPLDGLSFTDDGVTLNGVPLGGASGAEQVRVCAAIAVALNPECRVLCIPDASLLDSASWAMLAEMAEAENFQVFAEVVDEVPDDEGYYIEDGNLVQ